MIKIVTKVLVGIILTMSLPITPNEYVSADNSASEFRIKSAAIQGEIAEDVNERYSDTEYNYLINLTKETACISSWKGLFNESFKDVKDIILPTDVIYNEKNIQSQNLVQVHLTKNMAMKKSDFISRV